MSATNDGTANWRKSWRGSLYHAIRTHTTDTDRCWEWTSRFYRGLEDTCEACGDRDAEHVHHVVPVLAGGTSERWNLMALCRPCHAEADLVSDELPGLEGVLA